MAIIYHKAHNELFARATVDRWSPKRALQAAQQAEAGGLQLLADLVSAIMTDDRVDGVLSTRTHGLLGLPIAFSGGSAEARAVLEGTDDETGEWWRMHDEAELVRLVSWGLMLGVGLAQRIALPRVSGMPQRYKLDVWNPRWLRYSDHSMPGARWHVQTDKGEIPVVAGDGEWILFTPYGAKRPWESGKWASVVFPWLLKRYSLEDRANHSQMLGSPVWLGKASAGSTERQRNRFLAQLVALGRSGKVVLPEGWDLHLREATARSWEIYTEQQKWADSAITISLAGQIVTTEGTSGFSSGNIHDDIKGDLIRFDAERLATCLREQSLEPWALVNYGARADAPWPRWETEKPTDLAGEADALEKLGGAIKSLDEALKTHGLRVNVTELTQKYGVPTQVADAEQTTVQIPLAPTDIARTVRVNEVRSSNGLGPLLLPDGGLDPRGDLLIADLQSQDLSLVRSALGLPADATIDQVIKAIENTTTTEPGDEPAQEEGPQNGDVA